MAAAIGNKYAMGNSGGRPAHYDSAEEFAAASQDYFDWCLNTGIKSTVTGLALYLGFCSRSTFDDYDKRSEEFSYVVRRSKLAVENSYELSGTAFDIFALKNMGWKDKQEVEQSGNLTTHVKIIRDTASGITPGDFTPQPAGGTESKDAV